MRPGFWTPERLAAAARFKTDGVAAFPNFIALAETVAFEIPVTNDELADAFLFAPNGHIVAYHMMVRKQIGLEP